MEANANPSASGKKMVKKTEYIFFCDRLSQVAFFIITCYCGLSFAT